MSLLIFKQVGNAGIFHTSGFVKIKDGEMMGYLPFWQS
jgi:hypothetical protein